MKLVSGQYFIVRSVNLKYTVLYDNTVHNMCGPWLTFPVTSDCSIELS